MSQQQALCDAQRALHIQGVNRAVTQQQQDSPCPGLLGELGVGAALLQLPQRPPEQTGNPWRLWVDTAPQSDAMVTIWRDGTGLQGECRRSWVHPVWNIAGVWWRLA